mmetsp:Transcript_124507/g.248356  ORF Transcript_124507/g.248356 Transcript_124507/m.248356 type:complete len:256 (+) Transcript_124507:88-855(+)|eukprot:CAMPEP_0172673238 /NCGR_PEP_ID=MMETSP1074-20121228/12029_1 /TAXON_ID=2916 /ORGANISM="Ceratium fusus, Strain PA161109" /LENGTH=255 /DNA_ID=CAMNT_0013490513 /DNA_START=69 /DNA_END=836 /DNA_ORIENTATION=-
MDGQAQEEQPGAAWLDETDTALESFMQEEALVDALQSAPEHARVEPFEVETIPPAAAVATPAIAVGASSGVPPSGGSATAAASLARLGEPVGSSGLQERRTEATAAAESQRHTGARQPEAASSGGAEKDEKAKKAAKSGLPWRGAALVMMAILGLMLLAPGLFEEERVETRRPVRAEPRPIQMPAVKEDEGATVIANNTKVGQRLGSIGVSWSSGNATNASVIVAASGNNSATEPKGDHGRRQRMRGKAGNTALH